MITRSDPGGSVPRFLIDRGTPGGIVADASKFLNWACAKDMEEFDGDDEIIVGDEKNKSHPPHPHRHDTDLHSYQTNGHLAGLEEEPPETPKATEFKSPDAIVQPKSETANSNGGLYSMIAGGIGAAGGFVANHTPQIISSHLPDPLTNQNGTSTARRSSTSSISTVSTVGSFESALENRITTKSINLTAEDDESLSSLKSTSSTKTHSQHDKELQRLEDKKRKLDEKLRNAKEKEQNKKSEDTVKEEEALRKAEERHAREVKRHEEKYRAQVEKLQLKREKEERKAEERRRKAVEKDEKAKLLRELELTRAELSVLRKEKEILRGQVGDLQAENTLLAVKLGRLGAAGEEVLKSVKDEVGARTGRARASSLRKTAVGLGAAGGPRPGSVKRASSSLGLAGERGFGGEERKEKELRKENLPILAVPGGE